MDISAGLWRNADMFRFVALFLCLPGLLAAQDLEVDVELFLAVDVSRSMSPAELEIQRRGYAEALSSAEVLSAIQGGLLGRIAVTYVEWAGEDAQRMIVPWTLISNQDEAQEVADTIFITPHTGLRRTSISSALVYAADAFDDNGFMGLRRVIDVSGDGPNNQGEPVLNARQYALEKGLTVNGLPLMTEDALSELWGIPDLDDYYSNCVIGGPGAFVVPVLAWDQFARAVRRKLVLEIATHRSAPRVLHHKAQYTPRPAYDCLIGEKMWEKNRTYFDLP